MTILIIVELPTKAKAIQSYAGPGHQVKASFGHIRDLPAKDLGVDVDAGFKPHYIITNRKAIQTHLAEAKTKGPDKYHEVYVEMRIEVIAELANPAFHKEVYEWLQILLDRLMAGDDLEKLEMVLLLKLLLGMNSSALLE